MFPHHQEEMLLVFLTFSIVTLTHPGVMLTITYLPRHSMMFQRISFGLMTFYLHHQNTWMLRTLTLTASILMTLMTWMTVIMWK